MYNWSLKHDGSADEQRKEKIMMTTVMALAVVAVMIAKAINVNNHIEMGK